MNIISQKPSVVHVALRIPPKTVAGPLCFDVIAEHNRVIDEHGRVAFAKFGGQYRTPHLSVVREALEAGKRPLLYAFYRRGQQVFAWRAPISNALVNQQPVGVKSPEYYRKLYLAASCWFVLSGRFETCSLDGLYLVTNHRPVGEVVMQCRTVMMLVRAANTAKRRSVQDQ